MNRRLLFFAILSAGVLLEVAGDVFFKHWAETEKRFILGIGFALYALGSVLWAWSLKFEDLSKAGTLFMLLNVVCIAVVGVVIFKERLSAMNVAGIALAMVSIYLLEA